MGIRYGMEYIVVAVADPDGEVFGMPPCRPVVGDAVVFEPERGAGPWSKDPPAFVGVVLNGRAAGRYGRFQLELAYFDAAETRGRFPDAPGRRMCMVASRSDAAALLEGVPAEDVFA